MKEYKDGFKYVSEKHSCFYVDEMRTFIPMSCYSVNKYITNNMKSNIRFVYKCLDKLKGMF